MVGEVQMVMEVFFFQAEDGIRDKLVTGVQTCALPISFELSRGMRVGGVDSFFSSLIGLPSFRSIAGLTPCSTRSIEKPTHSFCLLTNANGGDAVRVPIVSTPD